MKKLIVAKNTGFCFGVRRTVQTAENLLKKYGVLYSIGDIVHNPAVMRDLESKGLRVVKSAQEVSEGPFIVRSHGIGRYTMDNLKKKGVEIYDATCPFLKKIHSLIKKLDRKKYLIIIVGDENHPEVIAIKEYGNNVCIVQAAGSFTFHNQYSKAAVIGQTTLSFNDYFKTARSIINNTDFEKIVLYNTICRITDERQDESVAISKIADMVFVLGGKNSSNTTKLYKNCLRFNKNTWHIESIKELKDISLKGIQSVGLLSGTSTPDGFIYAVKKYMHKKGYREVQYNGQRRSGKTS